MRFLKTYLESFLMVLIFFILGFTFLYESDKPTIKETSTIEDEFNRYLLVAWTGTHEKWNGKEGDIVKVKYRVTTRNTKLWMFNVKTGQLVHEQSYHRDPWEDKHRDFTYVWKLYKTERSDYIPPGTYEIVIGGMYEPPSTKGKLTTIITV